MKKIRAYVSSGAILPGLLMSSVADVQNVVAAQVVPGTIVVAQQAPAPTEEELRRRKAEEERKRQQQQQPAPQQRIQPPPQQQPAPQQHLQPAPQQHLQPAPQQHLQPPPQQQPAPHVTPPPVPPKQVQPQTTQPPATPKIIQPAPTPVPPKPVVPKTTAPLQVNPPPVPPKVTPPQNAQPLHTQPQPIQPQTPPPQPAPTLKTPATPPTPPAPPTAPTQLKPSVVPPPAPTQPLQPGVQQPAPQPAPALKAPTPPPAPPAPNTTAPNQLKPAVVPPPAPTQPQQPGVQPPAPQPGFQKQPQLQPGVQQPTLQPGLQRLQPTQPGAQQTQQPNVAPKQPIFSKTAPPTMAPPMPPAPQPGQPQPGQPQQKKNGVPWGAVAIGAGVGLVGGMIIGQQVRGINEVQQSRRTVEQDGTTFYSEPGRVIVREGDQLYVRHDETERFREFYRDVRVEQRGDQTVQIVDRPDGTRIITITDSNGQLLRRIRRFPDNREVILIDNTFRPRPRHYEDEVVVDVPPPPIDLPSDRYEVDASNAGEATIYETLTAPPVAAPPRHFTLDEVRNSREVRRYMPSVDINTITFSTGSWDVEDGQIGQLQSIADAVNRALKANPNEIYLIEGHTDAIGSDVDNLSLSDRRAQTVAGILTRSFNVPPENLTTQGYGAKYLKVQTQEAERANRRVTVRRITPLLSQENQQQPQEQQQPQAQ